jgi:hypothetical protein
MRTDGLLKCLKIGELPLILMTEMLIKLTMKITIKIQITNSGRL